VYTFFNNHFVPLRTNIVQIIVKQSSRMKLTTIISNFNFSYLTRGQTFLNEYNNFFSIKFQYVHNFINNKINNRVKLKSTTG